MKEKEICPRCKQLRYMTRHHVKNRDGTKTGEIEIMCRDCHDDEEEYYRLVGITGNLQQRRKIQKFQEKQKLTKLRPKPEPIIPYWALKVNN